MAFKKVNPSTLRGLLQEVVNFCKNNLNWTVSEQQGDEYKFKPFDGAETFTIKNLGTGNLRVGNTGTTYAYEDFEIYMGSHTAEMSHCGMIIGYVNVWLKGDSENFMCVIETSSRNFRWFGFGEVKKINPSQLSNISWCVAQAWGRDEYKNTIWDGYNLYGVSFFGDNAVRDYKNHSFRINGN